MSKERPMRYEKVDDNVIRIIVETPKEVSINQLLKNKDQLLQQLIIIEETLKNIDEILTEAQKLGISAKEDEKKEEKK